MFQKLLFNVYDTEISFEDSEPLIRFTIDSLSMFLNENKCIDDLILNDNISVSIIWNEDFIYILNELCEEEKTRYYNYIKSWEKILCFAMGRTIIFEDIKDNKER